MTSVSEFQSVVDRIADLLLESGLVNKAHALRRISDMASRDIAEAAESAKSLYGGSGSLSDIVLYAGNRPLVAENNELDGLRQVLHRMCMDVLTP